MSQSWPWRVSQGSSAAAAARKRAKESFLLAAPTGACPGQHFPVILLHPFSLHKWTLSRSSCPYQPRSRESVLLPAPGLSPCPLCHLQRGVPAATSDTSREHSLPLCSHHLLPQDPQHSFEWSRALTRAHLPDHWKVLLFPARHRGIIAVTLGLSTVPSPEHGICQGSRNMDDPTPAMWHLLEVSLCLLQFKCPAVLLRSITNKTTAQNQLCPQHFSTPCNPSLPQSKETLIPFGNELPRFTLDFPTHTCWLHQACAMPPSSGIRGAAELPVFISSHWWFYNLSCIPSCLSSELKAAGIIISFSHWAALGSTQSCGRGCISSCRLSSVPVYESTMVSKNSLSTNAFFVFCLVKLQVAYTWKCLAPRKVIFYNGDYFIATRSYLVCKFVLP